MGPVELLSSRGWTPTHMGKMKSQVELYVRLFVASLNSVASAYPDIERVRDIAVMRDRVHHEGLQFLTKTVPSYGKAIDYALSHDTPVQIRGFVLKRGSQLPLFLGSLLRNVFDDAGRERGDACPQALKSLRQICNLCYKLELPTTLKQNNEVIESFRDTDTNLPAPHSEPFVGPCVVEGEVLPMHSRIRPGLYRSEFVCGASGGDPRVIWGTRLERLALEAVDIETRERSLVSHPAGKPVGRLRKRQPCLSICRGRDVLRRAARLVRAVVAQYSPTDERLFAPRHGPGSVADGEAAHEKTSFTRYYHELHSVFPQWEYFCYNASHICDVYASYLSSKESYGSGTAKVVLVPKDSRGPRLISEEPKEYQWIQQGLRRVLEHAIESHPLTGGRINFRDQEVNRDLALRGSAGEPWVTLDMKDASDRVSCALVRALFPEPWLTHLLASRSTATRLPSGEVFPLRKFAPMGSSLCFPVESLIFWALAVSAITAHKTHLPLSQVAHSVYVFGDDLIVRSEDHATVLHTLPHFGLKFNERKCCTAGSFRESCGCDAFRGVDVTPLRLKSVWSHRNSATLASYVAFHNAACQRGLWPLADEVYRLVSAHRRFPYSEKEGQSFICWVDPRKTVDQIRKHNRAFKQRFCRYEQVPKILAWSICSRPYKAATSGWDEMLRTASLRDYHQQECWWSSVSPPGNTDGGPSRASFNNIRLKPASWNYKKFLPEELPVRAYEYTLRRRVSLKRQWHQIKP